MDDGTHFNGIAGATRRGSRREDRLCSGGREQVAYSAGSWTYKEGRLGPKGGYHPASMEEVRVLNGPRHAFRLGPLPGMANILQTAQLTATGTDHQMKTEHFLGAVVLLQHME